MGAAWMDRRRFVRTAGMLAGGSVFLGSLTSCEVNFQFHLPYLAPAAPPTPVQGMTYIWASKIGCALDCDLNTGRNKNTGGSATDDAPRINAAMASASASNPMTLIIDGGALISGLFLPDGGNWAIAGLGGPTGFYTMSGSNCDAIQNGSASAQVAFNPGPPAPARGENVSLSNFTLNGNQNGVSTTGLRQGTATTWYCGIDLINLDNITIENLVVANVPAFHVRLSNVGNVKVSGCILESVGLSTDGLHFDGPANDIAIANCQFATGDDSIALNCPEGYSGDISRVTVTNCTFNSLSLMRLYTVIQGQPQYRIDSVSLTNCNGTLAAAAFLIGLSSGSLPNSVASLTVTNCNLTAPAVLGLAENFGAILLQNVVFTPSQAGAIWDPPEVNRTSSIARTSPLYHGGAFAGSSLTLENCSIVRNSNQDVAVAILENNSAIANLTFNGFAMQDLGSYNPASELLDLEGGSIGTLTLTSLSSSNIQSPVESGGFANVASVTGAAVLATGWEFPDSVMANGVPYISASTGEPSIKVNGVVQPYQPS